jgi:hypothetical protein
MTIVRAEEFVCPGCRKRKSRQAERCAACSGYASNAPEARSERKLCGANKKDGGLCRAYAGQGTEHPGVGRCSFHGGNTPNHKKAAINLEVQKRMVTLGAPVDFIDPASAMLGMLRASAGHVNWLREQIIEMDDLGTREAEVILKAYDQERDRLARISDAAVRAGVTDADLRVEEAQGTIFMRILESAATTAGLSPTQREAFQIAALRELAEMDAPTDHAGRRSTRPKRRRWTRRSRAFVSGLRRRRTSGSRRPPPSVPRPTSRTRRRSGLRSPGPSRIRPSRNFGGGGHPLGQGRPPRPARRGGPWLRRARIAEPPSVERIPEGAPWLSVSDGPRPPELLSRTVFPGSAGPRRYGSRRNRAGETRTQNRRSS